MKLRRVLKEKLDRGHLEVTLSLERGGSGRFAVNRAGRRISAGISRRRRGVRGGGRARPERRVALPGALDAADGPADEELEEAGHRQPWKLCERLNHMREEEGRGTVSGIARAHDHISSGRHEVEQLREAVLKATRKVDKPHAGAAGRHVDQDRILQEAAMLAERSDIQEELVRMKNHIQHFLGLLDAAAKWARSWTSCCRR